MSAEEISRLISELSEQREKKHQIKKARALKKASGILKRLDKPVDRIVKEMREGWL